MKFVIEMKHLLLFIRNNQNNVFFLWDFISVKAESKRKNHYLRFTVKSLKSSIHLKWILYTHKNNNK